MQDMENMLTMVDAEGNERYFEVLFTVHSDEFDKDYVVFFDPNEADSENTELMAAGYVPYEDGTAGDLSDVETDEEWAFLEAVIADWTETYGQESALEEE